MDRHQYRILLHSFPAVSCVLTAVINNTNNNIAMVILLFMYNATIMISKTLLLQSDTRLGPHIPLPSLGKPAATYGVFKICLNIYRYVRNASTVMVIFRTGIVHVIICSRVRV